MTEFSKSIWIEFEKKCQSNVNSTADLPHILDNIPASDTISLSENTGNLKLVDIYGVNKKSARQNKNRKMIEWKPALVKFTSGSTGQPKGVALSADNLLNETENIMETLSMGTGDKILATIPLSHSYGFDLGVLTMLLSRAELHIRDGFVPRQTIRLIQDNNITIILGTPSMYRLMIDTRLKEKPDLSSVRFALSGTARLNPDIIDRFHDAFRISICQHYGSSESGAATNHVPETILDKKESVGTAMKNVKVHVLGHHQDHLPPGEEGEVVISSGAVAIGYVMGEPPDRNPISNGRYLTGDTGYLDNNGYLYVTGRIDRLINVGGLKVSPDEVTAVLESHPAVSEAAALGVKIASGEEVVYALVTLCRDSNENDILEYMRPRLAEHKIPRRIEIRDSLPRGATGKIKINPEDISL